MKDEIKEICRENDELVVYYEDNSTRTFDTLTMDVLDYITNLQQENERLKAINSEYERLNKQNGRGFTITNVHEYNINDLLDYKSRCEKAIEYIVKLWSFPSGNFEVAINEKDSIYADGNDYFDNLLNILQGSDEDE